MRSALRWISVREIEAIGLARKLNADYLMVDDRVGRRAARDLGLKVTGTLGVLGRADEQGLTPNLPELLTRLASDTNFRLHRPTAEFLLARRRG